MTALPLRPALADVLAVLTGTQPAQWSPESYRVTAVTCHWAERRPPPQGMGVDGGVPLTVTDPAEAFETLIARGVLPDAFAGDERRAFWCVHCFGRGTFFDEYAGGSVSWPCEYCAPPDHDAGSGLCASPPTIPALVAWASLGPAAILRAEELAREAVRRLRQWGAPQVERVVWRVGARPIVDHAAWRSSRAALSHSGVLIGHADHGHSGPIDAACALWDEGLALDAITADAVPIVVPPIGGAP